MCVKDTDLGQGIQDIPVVFHHDENEKGGESSGFSVSVSGWGSFIKGGYTASAHSKGKVTITLTQMAMSTDDVRKLNDLALSMLSASERTKAENAIDTKASASLSIWSYFFGGAKATFESTHKSMTEKGLTEQQITTLMEAFTTAAKAQSIAKIEFEITNDHDYPVSGSVFLYMLTGQIQTAQGEQSYRMYADTGSQGSNPNQEEDAEVNARVYPQD